MSKIKKIIICAMIAAVYSALTIALAPWSFGAVQVRVSEALTLIPFLMPFTAAGVFVGCLIANIIGMFQGVALPPDIIVGSLATLIAAFMTALIGSAERRRAGFPKGKLQQVNFKSPFLWFAPLPPVIINAVFIGALISFYMNGPFWALFIGNCASVFAGQAVACYILGIPLIKLLSTRVFSRVF